MTINLLKPALYSQDVYELMARQKKFMKTYKGEQLYPAWTTRKPQREDDLIAGGSIYWIVNRSIQCRQLIRAIQEIPGEDKGKPAYHILCDPEIIRTVAVAKKPFQGWRYLEPHSAPPDVGPLTEIEQDNAPPPEMAAELRKLGLL